jgi:hypothetical protein
MQDFDYEDYDTLSDDLNQLFKVKAKLANTIKEAISNFSDYATEDPETAAKYIDDIFGDIFNISELQENLDELETRQAVQERAELRSDYYSSQL